MTLGVSNVQKHVKSLKLLWKWFYSFLQDFENYLDKEHDYTEREWQSVKASKKLNCPAKIYIRHIIKFPEYEVRLASSFYGIIIFVSRDFSVYLNKCCLFGKHLIFWLWWSGLFQNRQSDKKLCIQYFHSWLIEQAWRKFWKYQKISSFYIIISKEYY